MGQDVYEELEREIALFLRRARAISKDFARAVHPELEADAYGLLIRIADDGGARGTDLADYYGIGKPTVSRQVRLLEELGLVERRPDPSDARAAFFCLTSEGEQRMERMRTARRERFQQMLREWDSGDAEQLARLLARLNVLFKTPLVDGP
ncbi:DNA-binding MarR family transcriptional regulator [Motilibacter peucedani]|uniref:DNA-binding MarR family transcriptional regulator n=1 Tax=Motilibacter peucedani TaxID=598650 RepID=A0A420XPT0_9ACTN|nr:MarR family transcriptional regulator [Motilibacter peucedani]RKS75291.1 DNA-binding MarR family transcriptional regulator [Motilibacter peucedani]